MGVKRYQPFTLILTDLVKEMAELHFNDTDMDIVTYFWHDIIVCLGTAILVGGFTKENRPLDENGNPILPDDTWEAFSDTIYGRIVNGLGDHHQEWENTSDKHLEETIIVTTDLPEPPSYCALVFKYLQENE